MSGFADFLKGLWPGQPEGVDPADGTFGYTPSPASASVKPGVGREKYAQSAALQGAAALIEGFQKAEQDRQDYNRELAFRNASMQQAYQNNLPAMFKLRQGARQSANALSSLAGL